jgi:diguanylate cyclase (GGDEF)-like protein
MRKQPQKPARTEQAPPQQTPEQEQADSDLRRLGDALGGRVDEVLARIDLLAHEARSPSPPALDPAVRESFQLIGRNSTLAVARWMAGGNPEAGRETGQHAWHTYGQMAAQSAAPLGEVTKRCLRWRDAVASVLRDCAAEQELSPQALLKALSMTQRTIDVTLVRMCEAFERERESIEEELARRQEELAFMATHDQLTGLPNRTLILDRGEQMLGRARRLKTPVAALLIELDNFTAINDSLGRECGDELLRAIAARLDGVVRDIDALGRIGGDEFVVLVEDVAKPEDLALIAGRMREALRAPFTLANGQHSELTVTASVGAVSGERPSVEEMLRDADIAMHRAKREGKNRHVVFESGMQDMMQSRMELEMDLRSALEHDEFFLMYQPTFDLRVMMPTGVEALIRWNRRSRGVVQPNDFIPLLEETGLIVEVGKWVLEQACRQGAKWRRDGHQITMAVNVSARQLESDQFIEDVRAALAHSELEARALTLEITETTLMRDSEETARRLQAIKELGVRIAIDDFGTGYSSFAHLQRFPLDALKIDRSFILQLADNPEGETLLRTLVKLGKALSMETVAEGIERTHHLSLLREERCDSGQGYLFARPLSVEAAEAFLQDWQASDLPDDDACAGGARSAATSVPARHG